MKRLISALLCIVLIFIMAACGGSKSRMILSEDAVFTYEQSTQEQQNQEQQQDKNQNQSQSNSTQTPNQSESGSGTTDNPQGSTQSPSEENRTNNPMVMGIFYRNVTGFNILSNDPAVREVDEKADAMLKKIEEYPDNINVSGRTYYISTSGSDSNSGLSPKKPKKTYASVKNSLKSGDAILFKRGEIFRGQIILVSGVTYGAYGEGIKPRLYGSIDGKVGEWVETYTKNVYKYNKYINKYSNIVLNNGKAIGRPVQRMSDITKRDYNVYSDGSSVTMYSPNGNPKDVFDSIEIVEGECLLTTKNNGLKDVKIQNLCMMYTGVHFLGQLGSTYNLEIEGCIMGYCGGRDLYKGGVVSLGNCVEVISVAVNINVHDNYFFQAYDAGVTHQGPSQVYSFLEQRSSTNYTNIHYEKNLIEYCTYDIEAFSQRQISEQNKSPSGKWTFNNVYIIGNICRYTGYGWGSLDRPDKNVYAHIKYDAQGEQDTNVHVKPLYIQNNIFDRSRRGVLGIQTPEWNKKNMILKNNLFLENDRANIFNGKTLLTDYIGEINKYFTATENTFKLITD